MTERIYPVVTWHAEVETITGSDGEWEHYEIRHTHGPTEEAARENLEAGQGVRMTGSRRVRQCPGSHLQGGVFSLPDLPEGITCQVCMLDFEHDGSGKPPLHRAQEDRVCEECGNQFTAKRPWAKFCSSLCRGRNLRRKM